MSFWRAVGIFTIAASLLLWFPTAFISPTAYVALFVVGSIGAVLVWYLWNHLKDQAS